MSSVFGKFKYILSFCGDYTRKQSKSSQIHAVFICLISFRIVFHSFWCRMMCFVCETMYSALFSVITTWFKGALIDFYIKICYNIYIRNDIFLECIHNKHSLLAIHDLLLYEHSHHEGLSHWCGCRIAEILTIKIVVYSLLRREKPVFRVCGNSQVIHIKLRIKPVK